MPKKGGLRQFADLRGGLGKKDEGGVFKGEVDTPMHTIINKTLFKNFPLKIQAMFSPGDIVLLGKRFRKYNLLATAKLLISIVKSKKLQGQLLG